MAYIFDESRDDDSPQALPALTRRRTLSFADTLLLVLLRERLDEHEIRDLDGARLILSADDIKDMLEVFFIDHPDARLAEQKILASIKRVADLGFLTGRANDQYEVRPLIRAKISADTLEEIKAKLIAFVNQDSDLEMVDDAESV